MSALVWLTSENLTGWLWYPWLWSWWSSSLDADCDRDDDHDDHDHGHDYDHDDYDDHHLHYHHLDDDDEGGVREGWQTIRGGHDNTFCLTHHSHDDDDAVDDKVGFPANSHHGKIPPWWEYVIDRWGGCLSRHIPTIDNYYDDDELKGLVNSDQLQFVKV